MKTSHSLLWVCASVACALLVGCSKSDTTPPTGVATVTPEGKMEMQFKWIVGKKYVVRMDVSSTSEIALPNQPQPMKQDTTMSQDYTISVLKELPDGGRELVLEFTGAGLELKTGDRTLISFDSTQDPSLDGGNPVAPMLRRTIGSRLNYTTDANGAVVSLKGFQELTNRVMSGIQPEIQASFGSMYNEGYLKQLCDAARMAPDRGVKPGDTWYRNIREDMGPLGTLAANMKMKFEGWEKHGDRKCARIKSTGEMTSTPSDPTRPAAAMAFQIDKGDATGTGWFDPELGMVVESISDQNLTMRITTQGQTLTSQINQKINFKLLDVVAVTD